MEASICPIDARFPDQISTLLSPPPLPQVQEYFEAIVAERQCSGLRVKPDSDHGKGVYSEVDFQEGDLVLKDQMLVGAQHSSNKWKIDCLVCSFCFRFTGLIELQIGRKLYLEELGVSAVDECGSSDETRCGSSSEKTRLPQDTIQSLMNGCLRLPYSENFPLPSLVPCLGGCKEAYYCSQYCAEADWDSFHSLLCIGRGSSAPNTEALPKFMKHANETNDIFIVAAKLYLPFAIGGMEACVHGIQEKSLQLLKEAIYDEECAPFYGHIIGMFELNNLDLVVASPVEDYFLYIDDLPLSQKKEAEKITKSFLDALGDDYTISCQAFKRDEDRDGQATIIALRPIIKEEEITISYIDEDLPYKERQELLADYGFTCKCPKCVEEGAMMQVTHVQSAWTP